MLSTELLAYYRRLGRSRFTVVDVETTGCYPPTSRVIEISVLQATLDAGILHQQTHLVNPGVRVPAGITRFTGITQRMVDAAPNSIDVWREYLPLLSEGVLTAHNLSFDYGFLKSEFNFVDVPFYRAEAEQLCTVKLSRLLLSELPSRSLPDLVAYFGFDVGRSHRAEADTLACWMLLERLLSEMEAQSDTALLHRFGEQWISLKAAAELLQVPNRQAKLWLKEAQVEYRLMGRYNTPKFQRAAVEAIYRERREP
ncbi:MAG: 3'-5' exonuclease [Leptolyngbyaceae cyanobacterium bins.349]|nr:3'-5' exonuclease [Leptolyngbyaceae cyanobacterium bins.349]